ncbi:MAG TPA: AMP-binding protein [Geobacteraceae bacterium]|nr:AMP-binding protein [Geobacteraceae bacterium]
MPTLTDISLSFPERGEKTAIIHRTGVRRFVYSFARLYELSLKVNSLLACYGIEKGDRVLLWGPNGPMWACAFWGCVARGAIIVPVDFMAGRERAETIARLTEAKLVMQSRFKPERITGLQSLMIEELEDILAGVETLAMISGNAADDIAQIVYTSGTTGNPKGVVLTHGNLMANLIQVNRHIPVVNRDFVFLSLLPLSHMFEQMGGFLTPMYQGAAIVYLRTLKPSAITEAIREEDIYAVIAVPRLLQLLRAGIERKFAEHRLEGLFRRLIRLGGGLSPTARKLLFYPVRKQFGRHFTLFVSGGAALAADDFRFWNSMGFVVIEGYGLTECSPVLTANTMESRIAGSVGKALPGVAIRIGQNEVLTKGENIFPGYYRDRKATEEVFTEDCWFRTGDLGELDGEGNLYIRGRLKELIVTGAGINVYPDELENILSGIAGVREACVIGMDRGSGEEVHAVIIPDGSARPVEEIIAEANGKLDVLQQITGFSVWPEADFPKTTTLKVRKFQVKETLAKGRTVSSDTSTDPFINLISGVTGVAAGDVREDSLLVSDLGLTSIARLELVSTLEREFRLDLDESVIDRNTRVSDLRKMVAERKKVEAGGRQRFWTNKPFFGLIRRLVDGVFHMPLVRAFMDLDVSGLDRLAGARPPVMFISNHLSYLDYAAIMFSLPSKWRNNTATAAWEEFFFRSQASLPMKIWKRFTFEYGTMVLNLFPLPQTGAVRHAIRFMGKLADMERNILLFPEGERSRSGALLPFRKGLGLMVKELRIPVVPIHISGIEKVMPPGTAWPKRGRVAVSFGEPLFFTKETPDEIVERARRAIEDLAKS